MWLYSQDGEILIRTDKILVIGNKVVAYDNKGNFKVMGEYEDNKMAKDILRCIFANGIAYEMPSIDDWYYMKRVIPPTK